MVTVVIQIGNTDNKLKQDVFSSFIEDIQYLAKQYGQTHFSGGASIESKYRNYCVVLEMPEQDLYSLTRELNTLRGNYMQDSIALTIGQTQFIEG